LIWTLDFGTLGFLKTHSKVLLFNFKQKKIEY